MLHLLLIPQALNRQVVEEKQLGLELAFVWDPSDACGSLTHHATVLSPNFTDIVGNFSTTG